MHIQGFFQAKASRLGWGLGVVLGALVLLPSGFSEEGMERPKMGPKVDLREICKKETQDHCTGQKPGGGRILECLKTLPSEKVGAECKAGLDQIRERQEKRKEHREEHRERHKAKFEAACGEDIKQFCEGTEHGQGRIAKCLLEKKSQLSESCKEHLEKMKPRRSIKKLMGGADQEN